MSFARGGQVYYVYNRVNDIADVAARIAKLVPEARVDFAHGQMSERELEAVMYCIYQWRDRCACFDYDHRDRPGYFQCKYHDHT